jgi:hypothetical protein
MEYGLFLEAACGVNFFLYRKGQVPIPDMPEYVPSLICPYYRVRTFFLEALLVGVNKDFGKKKNIF